MTALVFDKYVSLRFIKCRVNKDFICIQQFRPAMYFGASDLSKQTIKNPEFGFWYIAFRMISLMYIVMNSVLGYWINQIERKKRQSWMKYVRNWGMKSRKIS